jgi:hypothetical protein
VTTRAYYYRWAGFASLPVVAVPMVTPFVFGFFSYALALLFGGVGLLLAISGLWRGSIGAKICSLISIVAFVFSRAQSWHPVEGTESCNQIAEARHRTRPRVFRLMRVESSRVCFALHPRRRAASVRFNRSAKCA